jgi:putative flavoprotein involved in K+ transport
VLVVGSGNSGCQIAEELCGAGRRVYLSVSRHRRAPRHYCGKDYVWWQKALGETDATTEQRHLNRSARLITGVGGGHDIDLRQLAKDGVVLLGRLLGQHGGHLAIAADLRNNLIEGDDSFAAFVQHANLYAVSGGLDVPPSGNLAERLPKPREVLDPIATLDIAAADISTIIWANGFRYDFGWIDLPVFAGTTRPADRVPVHQRGITKVPGVYFLGLPWLHKYKSALLHGVGEDAEYLAEQIAGRARSARFDVAEWRT